MKSVQDQVFIGRLEAFEYQLDQDPHTIDFTVMPKLFCKFCKMFHQSFHQFVHFTIINSLMMDKSRSSVSLTNDNLNYMIENEYLNSTRHKQSVEYSRKCAHFYERLSTEVQGYYHIIYQLPEKLKECIQAGGSEASLQFRRFKDFLKNFFEIFTQLSHFQIEGLLRVRESRSEIRDGNFENFYECIQRYRAVQQQFEEDRTNYKAVCLGIENKYKQVLSVLKKVDQNFNGKFIREEHDNLKNDLLKKQKLQEQINSKIDIISANARKFQKQIMFYRQKLVSYKYDYIQKIDKLCKNAKQSLIEVLSCMNDLIRQSKQLFAVNKNQVQPKLEHMISDKKDTSEYINKVTKQYDEMISRYLTIIRILINIFTQISSQIKEEKGRQIEIIQQMNKYFEYNQCNITEVLNTLDIYTIFLKYLSQIGDKLIYSENNLRYLQKNVNKQKEITLTILKCNNSNERKLLASSHQKPYKDYKPKQNENNYMDNLFEQMSEVYIQNIICKIFHDFQETVIKIKEKFSLNQPTKKYTNNSMSMSHIDTSFTEAERRPFKSDIWLWREWRKEIDKQFINFIEVKNAINDMAKYVQKYSLEDKELQKLSCTFVNKKIKGILKLKTHGLTFQSIDNSQQYFIPFFKIDNIDMEINIITKAFMIETFHGNLTFADQNVKDIKRLYVSVQKSLDYFNQNNEDGKVVQDVLALSEEEIEFIKKRKLEIEKDLQKQNEYEHFNTIIVQNVTINDVYRVVYSDNKITIKSKEYECFPDSLMKKYNNYNQSFKKFEPPGPQFYSGVSGINFRNCPIYSERTIDYDHTLPKIPFFPQCCHNKQTVRVYWVSNEQFHVKQTNNTSGAPYTQDFVITMLTKVNKILDDIQIRFFIKVDIVNDFSMKKMVIGTAVSEAKWGNGILADEIKKCLLGYKRKLGKQGPNQNVQQSNLSDKTRVKQYKKTIKTLQSKNKMLIYVLGGVFLLNILIKIIF